jgi:hypothetical protein
MNKLELTNQVKLDEKGLDAILDVVSIAKSLPEYTQEHLKLIQSLQEIRKDTKVKSWTEAFAIHRKPIDETRLKKITLRHSINDERIPEILTVLKLKLGSLKEENFEQFLEVCQQLQQNMDLPIVAQGVLNKAKVAKTKPVPEFAPQIEPEQSNGSAIAKASEASLSEIFEQFENADPGTAQDVSGLIVEQLEDRSAAELAHTVAEGLTVLPKTLAKQVQRQMYDRVGTEQFSKNVVAKVQRLLKEKGVL